MLCLWINKSRTEDAACACCCAASIALYYTHMGVVPGGVECLDVLLRRFLWHAGSQKITHCVIQYICKTNTNSLICMKFLRLSSTRPHTARLISSTHPHQAIPSSPRRRGLSQICRRDWRLLQLNRYLSLMIRSSMTLVVSRVNLSAPTPARGLPLPQLGFPCRAQVMSPTPYIFSSSV